MMHGCKSGSFRDLTRVFQEGTLAGASDRLLLDQFLNRRDDAAFESLLRRHGPLVLNICRKLLRDDHEVEDAFQATFLVLVRKAGSLRFEESLAPWISTVAYRVAARAREQRIRQNARERAGELVDVPAPGGSNVDEMSRIVHEELGCLPERLRAPLVCCYLEGMTHEAAAAQLGCPVGTVRSRLARARDRLQKRLIRRGVSPADGTSAMLLLQSGSRQVPAKLLRSTLLLVLKSGLQAAGAGVASASVLSLVKGVLAHMVLRKTIVIGSLLLPLGAILTAGAVGFAQSGGKASRPAPRNEPPARQDRREPVAPLVHTFPRTYFVGDLIGTEKGKKDGQDGVRVNMEPLVDLIRSTIAPGSWRVVDTEGHEIRVGDISAQTHTKDQVDQDRRIGTITPFFLSISLIVRHNWEVHDQIAKLLKFLRDFKYQKFADSERRPVSPAPASDHLPVPVRRPPVSSQVDRKQRLKQLLDELRQEIDTIDQNGDRPEALEPIR